MPLTCGRPQERGGALAPLRVGRRQFHTTSYYVLIGSREPMVFWAAAIAVRYLRTGFLTSEIAIGIAAVLLSTSLGLHARGERPWSVKRTVIAPIKPCSRRSRKKR